MGWSQEGKYVASFGSRAGPLNAGTATEFQITIDPTAHQTYGLYYPVTYEFQVPAASSNLTAQYRYGTGQSWITLTGRTAADSFNGINAVRFDYTDDIAYISVSFSLNSDVIYVRVMDAQTEVPLSFSGISSYYDNRQAVVVISLDDWNGDNDSSFDTASSYLTAAHIHFSVSIISRHPEIYMSPDWSLIQSWYDQGYLEPAGHARTHPCSDADYQIYGYDWEVSWDP